MTMLLKRRKTIFIAMSGGVDSSVAAALLKKAGFNIVGVFIKPWQPKNQNSTYQNCLWQEDREDALLVAVKLNIPLLTWDLSKEYEAYVVKYMIDGYKNGFTPNPDVMCNKFIKFGIFLNKSLSFGADYIATGHYVRIKKGADGNYILIKGRDLNKDQSYFLYTLNQNQLKYCLFPIGNYFKSKVREMAKKFGLPNWNKKDSQGICFIGHLKMDEFLKQYIKQKNGLIIRKSDNKILGEHNGVWFYTIGQRHGLNLSGFDKRYYVVSKDIKANILYVDEKLDKNNNEFEIGKVNWINPGIKFPLKCKVKIRYRQKEELCLVKRTGLNSNYLVKAENSKLVPALGQAAVFYHKDKVLGGGIIIN